MIHISTIWYCCVLYVGRPSVVTRKLTIKIPTHFFFIECWPHAQCFIQSFSICDVSQSIIIHMLQQGGDEYMSLCNLDSTWHRHDGQCTKGCDLSLCLTSRRTKVENMRMKSHANVIFCSNIPYIIYFPHFAFGPAHYSFLYTFNWNCFIPITAIREAS